MLGYARIEAPFDGVVTRRNVDTGDLTRPGPRASPAVRRRPVRRRHDRRRRPRDLRRRGQSGRPASVKLQAMNGRVVEGNVTRISWALDPKTRTIRVEIDIPNPGGKLRPGLYAYATVVAEEHPDVLTVPATAIVEENGQRALRRGRRRQGRAPPLALGLNDGTRAEVVSGLDGARPWSRPTPPRSPTASPSRSSSRPADGPREGLGPDGLRDPKPHERHNDKPRPRQAGGPSIHLIPDSAPSLPGAANLSVAHAEQIGRTDPDQRAASAGGTPAVRSFPPASTSMALSRASAATRRARADLMPASASRWR